MTRRHSPLLLFAAVLWIFLARTVAALAEGWEYKGCIYEGAGQRVLSTMFWKGDGQPMTPTLCTSYCQRQGSSYAGIAMGAECFCSSRPPTTTTYVDASTHCTAPCDAGDEPWCGGYAYLSFFQRSSGGSVPNTGGSPQSQPPPAQSTVNSPASSSTSNPPPASNTGQGQGQGQGQPQGQPSSSGPQSNTGQDPGRGAPSSVSEQGQGQYTPRPGNESQPGQSASSHSAQQSGSGQIRRPGGAGETGTPSLRTDDGVVFGKLAGAAGRTGGMMGDGALAAVMFALVSGGLSWI